MPEVLSIEFEVRPNGENSDVEDTHATLSAAVRDASTRGLLAVITKRVEYYPDEYVVWSAEEEAETDAADEEFRNGLQR
jgi:hypothetical protein